MDGDTVPVQVALGEAGACPVIEWQGKRYTLGHPTQRAKALFEDGIIDAERRGLDTLLTRRLITPAKYDERLETLGKRIDRREHCPGGSLWMQYAVGQEATAGAGTMVFLWSLFAQHHPALTFDDVRKMADDCPGPIKLALRRVVPDFFQWVGEVLKLPPESLATLQATLSEAMERLMPTDSTP